MIVTLRGGPYNGQKVTVEEGAGVWYCVVLDDDRSAMWRKERDITAPISKHDGVYAEGLPGSGNFYWIGIE